MLVNSENYNKLVKLSSNLFLVANNKLWGKKSAAES